MKRIVILAIVIAVIVVGWSAAWFYASSVIRQDVLALAAADGVTGPKLVCQRLDIGGYPLFFDVTCGGLTVTSGDVGATVAEVKASVLVTDPFHAVVFATGPLMLSDAFSGSSERLDWKSVEASARLEGWRIGRISIVGDTLTLDNTVGDAVNMGKAAHAELHLVDISGEHDAAKGLAALALYAKLDGLNAPGFQVNAGEATLDADISGLSDDVRTYGDADMLKRWQAAGGTIKLVGLKASDGEQDLGMTGAVSLDSAGHPDGQLSITSKGLVERFGDLVPAQWRALVLGSPGADGTYSQTLNLKGGVVFSGLIPLGDLPALM